MTAVTDVTLILETLMGRDLTGTQLVAVGNAVVRADPYGIFLPVDPENPTNEEIAQLIRDTMFTHMKRIVRKGAEASESDTAYEGVKAAGDEAVSNLE